jgi:DNA-directed RNA polymerase specialized sigma24 family protein
MSETDLKKMYLRKYLFYVRREEELLSRINELRIDKSCPSVVNDGMPHKSSPGDLSGYAAAMDSLVQEARDIQKKAADAKRDTLKRILKLQDKEERTLLRLKYIQGLEWGQIAMSLGYRRTKIFDMHKSAIEHFKI